MEIEKEGEKKQVEGSKQEDQKDKNNGEDVHAMIIEKTNSEESNKSEELNKQELQKQILKDKFLLVNARLSTGCNRERCRFDTCLCFPENAYLKNNHQAVKKRALEIIKERLGNTEICSILENPIPSLQAKEIETLFSQDLNLTENFNHILIRVGSVFSDIDSLRCSFLDRQDTNLIHVHTDKHHGHIDFTALNGLFTSLLSSSNISHKEAAIETLKNSFDNLLKDYNTLESFSKEFNSFDSLRVLGILIFFLGKLSDSHAFFEVIWKYLQFISEEQMQTLGYYLVGMNQAVCQNLNSNIHTEVMIHLFDAETQSKDLEEVEVAMNIMKILYLSNTLHKRLEREEFMMSLFDQNQEECLHPVEEYKAWRQMRQLKNKNKRAFSFCMYPFAMDIKFKYLLLEINSKQAQRYEHEQLIRSLIDQGHMFMDSHQLYLIFEVGRETILNDTLTAISKPNQNYKLPFKVKFKGEQGIDEGGVRKEYYQIMIKQLFNADFGLFNEKQNKQYFWFNGNSLDMPMLFELIGSLMGIAIYNQIQMDVRLPHVVYKKLIGDPVSLEDIEQFDSATFKGLSHILAYEGDLENDLQQTFAIEYEVYGETHLKELKPNGENIPVTQDNKEEYVELYVDWILNKSIEKQFNNFKRGFFKVIDADISKLFTYDELVLILTGKEELDFEELKANTVYDQGYSEESEQVKWLWEILAEFDPLLKKKFLFFCTGSDRAPVTGFASVKFIIARNGDDNTQLPSAHTCFNHLLIPEYKSKEILKQKLMISLANAEGFGLY